MRAWCRLVQDRRLRLGIEREASAVRDPGRGLVNSPDRDQSYGRSYRPGPEASIKTAAAMNQRCLSGRLFMLLSARIGG